MLRISCSFCRRRGRGEQLPRGWKIFADAVFCGRCRRQRYRLRSITMAVAEPVGAAWEELRATLEESWIHVAPCDGVWEAEIVEGHPVVRVLIGDRQWELRLKRAACCNGGKKLAYEEISSGAATGELFLDRVPTADPKIGNGSGCDPNAHSEIMCRIVAWLPRGPMQKAPQGALPARASQFDHDIPDLEKTDIRDLRKRIRANRVSFPSQVPTFPEHNRPSLQRKLALLYFVLGWNCRQIGARYGLGPMRVRQILKIWKLQAVKAGYIQHIPPAEVMSQAPMVTASLDTSMTATPDLVPQFVPAPFSGAARGFQAGGFQNDEHGIRAQ